MEQLEAKTNVSRATIYRRVGNKETLLKRLAQERGETFKKTDLRLNILKAARSVFSREGLIAATMEQIAIEAKVGVATIYRYFGDKESLVYALVEELSPRTAVRTLALQPSEDVAADLETIVSAVLPFFHENRDMLRLVFMGSETERRYLDSLRERSDSTLAHLTNYFSAQMVAGRLKKAGEASELALTLVGMALAFAVIGPLHYGMELDHPERSSKLIVSLFLNDLRGGQ
ncbi:MAG: TetR/AcrR family transcriptional regulator [Chloroflexales bacterium]|nr:TetR/AcrR family transcriptional regulator [Chloroflexales bacterium]